MKYKTCVSIAEKTPYKIKQILKIALKKSDYAEVRFDFLKIEQIPEAIEIIKKYDSIEYAKKRAKDIMKDAWQEADKLLPESKAKERLNEFVNYLIERKI